MYFSEKFLNAIVLRLNLLYLKFVSWLGNYCVIYSNTFCSDFLLRVSSFSMVTTASKTSLYDI